MPESLDQNWGGSSTIASAYGYSIGRKTQMEPHTLHELRRQIRRYEGSKVTRIHQTVYRLGAAQRGNSRDLRGCLEDAELSSDQCISVWKLPEAGKETSKAIEEMVLTRVPRIVLVSPQILIHGALGLRLVLPQQSDRFLELTKPIFKTRPERVKHFPINLPVLPSKAQEYLQNKYLVRGTRYNTRYNS